MRATFLPAQRTPLTWHDALWAFARAYEKLIGVLPLPEALAIFTGQSALETGNWESMYNFNFKNSKATPEYEGFYTQYPCSEILSGVERKFRPPHPQCNFRAYEDAPSGAKNSLVVVRHGWPKAWGAAHSGNVEVYCRLLQEEHGRRKDGEPKKAFYTANMGLYTKSVAERVRRAQEEILKTPDVVGGLTGELMDAWDPKTRRT
jgi:hypothetical protein